MLTKKPLSKLLKIVNIFEGNECGPCFTDLSIIQYKGCLDTILTIKLKINRNAILQLCRFSCRKLRKNILFLWLLNIISYFQMKNYLISFKSKTASLSYFSVFTCSYRVKVKLREPFLFTIEPYVCWK